MAWAARPEIEDRYPLSCKAARDLKAAFNQETTPNSERTRACRQRLRLASHRRQGAPATGEPTPATGGAPATCGRKPLTDSQIRTWRCRTKKKMSALQEELSRLKASKDARGRVSEEWLVRVLLTAPNVSGRAMSEAFHLAVGSDSNMISRESIGNIRAAFLEMYKAMIFSAARDFIAVQRQAATGACGAATGARPKFVGVHVTHVQDEADLRLLTSDAGSRPDLPRRSRSSKVQCHVVLLQVKGRVWELPTELEALGDKSAKTLATSFERLLLTWIPALVPPPECSHRRPEVGPAMRSHRHPEVWLVHCLVGDGIPTNQAAAKLLWATALANTGSVCISSC